MKQNMMIAGLLLALSANAAQATVITQWNFNSVTPDNTVGTGTIAPSIGTGTASVLSGVTSSFASGDANGGSSDPAAGDDSGWQTTGYKAQGSGNKTAGTQYLVSTAGYENIAISYDLRHSNTSSRYEQVQYTTDGVNFLDIGALFDGNAGDTWFKGRSVDLSSIAAVANNPLFGFRVVTAFAPATSSYAASSASANYAASGTWRFDMVTVSGTAIVPTSVPVPAAAWLFGSVLIGFLGVSRRKA